MQSSRVGYKPVLVWLCRPYLEVNHRYKVAVIRVDMRYRTILHLAVLQTHSRVDVALVKVRAVQPWRYLFGLENEWHLKNCKLRTIISTSKSNQEVVHQECSITV